MTVFNDLIVNGDLRIERTTNSSSNTFDAGLQFVGGDQTLGGTGRVELFSNLNNSDENNLRIRPTSGGSLTIGADLTIENAAGSQFTTIGNGSLPLVNLGTIVSQSAGKVLRVTGSTVTNGPTGELRSLAGTLDVNNASGDLGMTTVAGGATLDVAGEFTNTVDQNLDASTLIFSGDWRNTATIDAVNGSTLTLGGVWSNNGNIDATDSTVNLTSHADDLGAFSSTNSRINIRSRYTTAELESIAHTNSDLFVEAGGILENTGDVLTLSETAIELFLSGGTIQGGAIESSDSTRFVGTSGDGTLVGVTLNSDALLGDGAIVTVRDGLTVNGLLRLERNSGSSSSTVDTALHFAGGDQTLGGSGIVELFNFLNQNDESSLRIRPTSGGALTIGENLTVQSASNSQYTTLGDGSLPLTILGTVISQAPGRPITLAGNVVTNSGTLNIADTANFNVRGDYVQTAAGAINATANGRLGTAVSITGRASLAGPLNVIPIGDLDLNASAVDIIRYGSHQGRLDAPRIDINSNVELIPVHGPTAFSYEPNSKFATTIQYQNDFEAAAGAEWNNQTLSTFNPSTQFLGRFGNQSVTLTLSGLPTHTAIQLELDLLILDSWDGLSGADFWGFEVAGATNPVYESAYPNSITPDVRQQFCGHRRLVGFDLSRSTLPF